ncbi:MAG: L,D-transpeptidase [Anaerolineae bacterium]|nr:L,D-transpeptidase [Thermoflexus sp.]MDW8065438.1 L,D-transpeptidase [Anaerolineae bacterium]
MGSSTRSPELQALQWARRALRASSAEEALWWAARAYAAAPASPTIRAVLRRIRKRFPNAQGRPPARRPNWVMGVLVLYGLLALIGIALIAWGLGALDPWISPGGREPLPSAAEADLQNTGSGAVLQPLPHRPMEEVDLRRERSEESIPGVRLDGFAPAANWPTAAPTPSPSPFPSPSPSPSPSPIPTRKAVPKQTSRPIPTIRARASSRASPTPPAQAPFHGRWILVDLSDQELRAYEGKTLVLQTKVSTGRPRTPTVIGTFRIYMKLRAQTMTGPDYRLPNVPYVMYFYRGYALHGTYWHNNFGHPMSHGCVNLPTPIAEQLYHWADIGTPVVVQP